MDAVLAPHRHFIHHLQGRGRVDRETLCCLRDEEAACIAESCRRVYQGSAGTQALPRRPARAHAGPPPQGAQINKADNAPGCRCDTSFSLWIIQLATAASRAAPPGRRTRSATPTLDPGEHSQGIGTCEEDGKEQS